MTRNVAMVLWLLILLSPLGTVQAQLPASSSSQSMELLSDKDAWDLDDTAQFLSNGKLQLTAADQKPEEPQAVRRIQLPPASAWEAELRVIPQPGTSAAGLLFLSADENWISVMLNPVQRSIQVTHGNSLTDDLLVLLKSDKLSSWADSGDQVLKVRGDGGKLQVWLNGQDLGYGNPYDFEPQNIALRSEGSAAQFSSLNWRAAGTDGRLARLSGKALIPGRPPLMEEKFGSATQEILGGLMGGLMGRLTGKKQEDKNQDSWPKNSRDERSAFTRDTSTKRLRLEGLQDRKEVSSTMEPSSMYPLRDAAVAITARVVMRATPAPNATSGLYLEDRWRSGKPNDEQGNLIYVSLTKGQLRLEQFNSKTEDWALLSGYLWPHKDKEVELRLVARSGRAWVFVDQHLVINQPLEGMFLSAISGGGLRVEGLGAIEASSFRIDEL